MVSIPAPRLPADGPALRSRWLSTVIAYLMILLVAVRALTALAGQLALPGAIVLALFILLYATAPRLLPRYAWYPAFYFLLQTLLFVLLAWLLAEEDVWAVLVMPLSYQLVRFCSRRTIIIWAIVLSLALLVTLMNVAGPLPGLGFAFYLLAVTVFYLSYDAVYVATERARVLSQTLLAELQKAHQQLEAHTAQADTLAAAQERHRLVRELHDAVGQLLFSIRLNTEAALLLLEKEPARLPAHLDTLYGQCTIALAELRTLIGHWRPAQPSPPSG